VSPTTEQALTLEALRCCSDLLVAFAYEDAWPASIRSERKLGRKATALIEHAFGDDRGRDAISWAAQRYGNAMAESRRRVAGDEPSRADALEATVATDEWLAGLVKPAWPVRADHEALAFARRCSQTRSYDPDAPDAPLDLHACADRAEATIEILCLAVWPSASDLEDVYVRWSYSFDLEFDAAILADWEHVSHFWANLINPDLRRPYGDIDPTAP
jgi:hypothetical protein